jgi:DNA invertase Pin-like site-specific DNA recombinase
LKKETVERLRVLAKQYDWESGCRSKIRPDRLPIAGTRLIREWQGTQHCATVRVDDFEYQGQPYKSISAIARAITKVRWNGWVFFGLKNRRGAAWPKKQLVTVSPPRQKLRCAVYTRKSSEEGLEMEFNSLEAQWESCEAYVASQRAEGWMLVHDRYDDGGFSGGTLERPALKRLRADIEAGKVDVVVVYKIDRLSRSLMDFSRLVEVFDRHQVTFVSVTQSFNTTTSMGQLTLNVLLSFAQFEREVIGERIRDKFAASRKRGMWMGGWAPLGYEVKDRKLIVNEVDANLVRSIFQRFVKLALVDQLVIFCCERFQR